MAESPPLRYEENKHAELVNHKSQSYARVCDENEESKEKITVR